MLQSETEIVACSCNISEVRQEYAVCVGVHIGLLFSGPRFLSERLCEDVGGDYGRS